MQQWWWQGLNDRLYKRSHRWVTQRRLDKVCSLVISIISVTLWFYVMQTAKEVECPLLRKLGVLCFCNFYEILKVFQTKGLFINFCSHWGPCVYQVRALPLSYNPTTSKGFIRQGALSPLGDLGRPGFWALPEGWQVLRTVRTHLGKAWSSRPPTSSFSGLPCHILSITDT